VSGPEYRHIGPGGLSVVCRYDNRRRAEVGNDGPNVPRGASPPSVGHGRV